jgi:predicted nucleic acid-binding protein
MATNIQSVCIDSCILIYLLEQAEPYSAQVFNWLENFATSNVRLFASELAVSEFAVKPYLVGNASQIDNLFSVCRLYEIALVPINHQTLLRSAQLRALALAKPFPKKLGLADSIHLATAVETNCTHFFTNDLRLSGYSDVEMLTLTA